MLIHAMVISLLLLVFTGTILTQAVVASKIALQASVARYLEAAAGDGVADLTAGMQYYVKYAGSAGPWQAGAGESRSPKRPVCAETVAPDECPFTYDIAARVTGSTTASSATGAGTDVAINLQSAVIDEQRVSAQVTVRLYPRQSDKAIGSRTRYLTYRVFNSAPYAIISGVRDGTTENGLATSAQGDTSGAPPLLQPAAGSERPIPDIANPDLYRDTTIKLSVTCSTINPAIEPQAPPGNEGLPWGVDAENGYELSCNGGESLQLDMFSAERSWQNGNTRDLRWAE
jgi:hypothetical protein